MQGIEEDFRAGRGFSVERLRPYARTESGAAWLAEALHTPVEQPNNHGMPDNDCSTSALVRYHPVDTIDPPATITGTDTWSAAIYVLPHLTKLTHVRKWRDASPSAITSQFVANRRLVTNTGVEWRDLTTGMRCIGRSATCRLNAPALSDQGRVYACQLRPSVATGYAAASAVQEQSTLMFAHDIQSGGDVVEASSKPYQAAARKGSYTPCAFSQPVNPYRSSTQILADGTAKTYSLVLSWLEEDESSTLASLGTGPPFADMTVGVHLYTGLSASATIELTNHLSFEVLPTSRSTWVPFQTPGAVPDSMAVDNYFVIRHSMPDAFEEEANFLGALAGLASKVLPQLASWAVPKVTSWLAGKAGQPQAVAPAPVAAPPPPAPAPRAQAPAAAKPTAETRPSRSKSRRRRRAQSART